MGVGSKARWGVLRRDRSLRLGPSRPGGDCDLVPSVAVAGKGVGPEVGRGASGVCFRSPSSQLSSGRASQAEPALTSEGVSRDGGGNSNCCG